MRKLVEGNVLRNQNHLLVLGFAFARVIGFQVSHCHPNRFQVWNVELGYRILCTEEHYLWTLLAIEVSDLAPALLADQYYLRVFSRAVLSFSIQIRVAHALVHLVLKYRLKLVKMCKVDCHESPVGELG